MGVMSVLGPITELRVCEQCGIQYFPTSGPQRFCSKSCYKKRRVERRRQKQEAIECLYCERSFRPVDGATKYCSHECYWNDLRRKRETKRTCKVCGAVFLGEAWRTCCSPECRAITRQRRRPGDLRVDQHGYVEVMLADRSWAYQHRVVKAQEIGRPLLPWPLETVNHIDNDKSNNDPSNLQLRRGNHGIGVAMSCLDCGSCNVACVPLAGQ